MVVAPPLPYGASGEHQDFPGTVSIGQDALHVVLVELVRSLSTWARRTVVVNGHGGNAATLARATDQLRNEGHDVSVVHCVLEMAEPSDAHAGHAETSALLHLRPDLVDMSRAQAGRREPLDQLLPELMTHGVRAVCDTGVLGDPTSASAVAGADALDRLVARVVAEVDRG